MVTLICGGAPVAESTANFLQSVMLSTAALQHHTSGCRQRNKRCPVHGPHVACALCAGSGLWTGRGVCIGQ
jgi:hypothetical protein